MEDVRTRRGADVASDHHLVVANLKQLHDTTKKLSGKYSKTERPVKDKEGKPITETQQQRNRWVEYFEELLNRLAPMNPPDIKAAPINLSIVVNPPTTEESRMAVRQIKSSKGERPDNEPAEALKKHHRLARRLRCRRKDKDWQSKDRIPTIEEHMELKTTFIQYQSSSCATPSMVVEIKQSAFFQDTEREYEAHQEEMRKARLEL
ncbi:unnamed protein product [Schistosoma margrebowiei]|uniref:Uncharacterized protein n=1 Tax=Schistosoma margrebowiei TaxID=48269 RepID=A0A183N1N1_9TREM|nr:unnamed protein product [Schistosoma margrebowiei]